MIKTSGRRTESESVIGVLCIPGFPREPYDSIMLAREGDPCSLGSSGCCKVRGNNVYCDNAKAVVRTYPGQLGDRPFAAYDGKFVLL